ncbi:D-aminoacyl-tRNA deacylase [Sediminispirochaeta smaragdinae]|jgi:D-tyrosyl-tRNA(Tyr) deacylase|uniref:D-aminoacyl-tRNA deacylase n=1 Tax=Sediminispirochaeta smaragdinae (strain DSM 11293 / JCM 15392 / SEBR 4228) TaxID=573413 RepID=E1R2Y6_SEDSS|nr:D-aminoacyl-tRNA deacylase [Sediminispirochaeta smaragdinae]ADK81172.1 D-tyrosyl-tRNA(Tyr) deacylase [Sediminispirochaeta smaragdinae DSM 11293]
MRAVVQRVKRCTVTVEGQTVGEIGHGLLVYLGVEHEDGEKDLSYLEEKISGLRIFQDEAGKMNLSVLDVEGSILVVSQFTLCADTRKGKRPSYNFAADPEIARKLYREMAERFSRRGIHTETGKFGASMDVDYINQGPVTILLDSRKRF